MLTLDYPEEVFMILNLFICLYLINDIFCMIEVLRDIRERGRDLEQVLSQYTSLVKPAFEEFCLPVIAIFLK